MSGFNSFLQRLDRETCIWRRLNHRNIVPFFGAFDIDPRCPLPVLISPYYEFGHIGMYLKRLARADRVQLVSAINSYRTSDLITTHKMHDVVSGMKHLHDHGVHGDVKPVCILRMGNVRPLPSCCLMIS
jgi:serine/threonine protein kinase